MFESISRRFQLKFKDRLAAGNILADILKDRLKKEKLADQCIVVLGVPRGGVVTADTMVKKLSSSANISVDFDIVIPRKLTDPDNKEEAIGAIMEDGTTYLDEELINDLQIAPEYLEKEKSYQIEEIRRRSGLYRTPITTDYNLADKTVILVDDGAATGATIIVAARWIRKTERTTKRLIIAVPVAPKDTVKLLKHEADIVEVVTSPSSIFNSVGQFYQEFNPVPDEKVIEILRTRNMLI